MHTTCELDREPWMITDAAEWLRYGAVWIENRVLPFVLELAGLERDTGVRAADLILADDDRDLADRARRWAFMQAKVEKILWATRRTEVASSAGLEVGLVLSEDSEAWGHYHSYFEVVELNIRGLLDPKKQEQPTSDVTSASSPDPQGTAAIDEERFSCLTDGQRQVYIPYIQAVEVDPSLTTDRQVYEALSEVFDQPLTKFETWSRTLRHARRRLGEQKRRSGRLPITRTIRPVADMDQQRSKQ